MIEVVVLFVIVVLIFGMLAVLDFWHKRWFTCKLMQEFDREIAVKQAALDKLKK